MKRNNSDVMNNFFINYTVRAFTNIEKMMKQLNTQDTRRQQKYDEEVEKRKLVWEKNTLRAFDDTLNNYENIVKKQFNRQTTISEKTDASKPGSGSGKKETGSTNSSQIVRAKTSKSNIVGDK